MVFKKGEIRKLLKLRRMQAMMSQVDVCIALGLPKMNQTKYSYIERGYLDPCEEEAEALVELFDLPADYFATESQRGA